LLILQGISFVFCQENSLKDFPALRAGNPINSARNPLCILPKILKYSPALPAGNLINSQGFPLYFAQKGYKNIPGASRREYC